jgi:RimJ/RimL family protein N-acetyltransferase
MRLIPRLAETDEDVETLRRLRNETREWMTGNTAEITPEQQAAWWPEHVGTVWLYAEQEYEINGLARTYTMRRTVGYAYLRPAADEQIWVTVGLTADARGKGYGAEIHAHVAMATPCRVWAETRADNLASIKCKERVGWRAVGGEERAEYAVVYHVSPLCWREKRP